METTLGKSHSVSPFEGLYAKHLKVAAKSAAVAGSAAPAEEEKRRLKHNRQQPRKMALRKSKRERSRSRVPTKREVQQLRRVARSNLEEVPRPQPIPSLTFPPNLRHSPSVTLGSERLSSARDILSLRNSTLKRSTLAKVSFARLSPASSPSSLWRICLPTRSWSSRT